MGEEARILGVEEMGVNLEKLKNRLRVSFEFFGTGGETFFPFDLKRWRMDGLLFLREFIR